MELSGCWATTTTNPWRNIRCPDLASYQLRIFLLVKSAKSLVLKLQEPSLQQVLLLRKIGS
jgi:hypothetical protein